MRTQTPYVKQPGLFFGRYARPMVRALVLTFFFPLLGVFPAQAQSPELLKDINGQVTNNSQSSTGYNFFGMGGVVYFSADDGQNGFELWKTTGTSGSTVLVKDINPGSAASNPTNFTVFNGLLFFTATSNSSGLELWKTDGTDAGTLLVKDIVTGTSSSSPQNLLVVNGVLYFTATGSGTGRELWKTDGTDAGTVLVRDINTGSASSSPGNMTALGTELFFTATTVANGLELWKSDGTTAGTSQVKDIQPGAAGSGPGSMTVVGTQLFFTATEGTNGAELWRTDGTDAGTVLVKDIQAGINGSFPTALTALGNRLLFRADDGIAGEELWVSDGTDAGTVLLLDADPGPGSSFPNLLTVMGTVVYFRLSDPVNGTELWKTDGTAPGTVMVLDINAGPADSNPDRFVVVNNTLFFVATTAANGQELWKSDGTGPGTVLVRDIVPGSSSSSPNRLTRVNNELYFTAFQGSTLLMKSDGTDAGTVALNSTVVSNGTFATFFGFDNRLYFLYNGFKPGIPQTATGNEPWVSDGTDGGTGLLKDINATTNAGNPGPYVRMGNHVYFSATESVNGTELWKSDGTEAGTVLLKDIRPGTAGSSVANFITVNNTVYFTANDGVSGGELWKTDGTAGGTVLVKDIVPGSAGSGPSLLTDVNGTLFFVATTPAEGQALWKSDGTAAGTVLVADIIPGATPSPNIQRLTAAGNTLFFVATVSPNGTELWKSDGTAAGTSLVKDIVAGTGSPGIANLIGYNGKAYFNANDGVNGNEPWVSDGTEAGTMLFVNIATSTSFPNSNPTNFAVANNKLYFTAFTAGTQFEPWVSDGTPGGTYMITEVVPSGGGSLPFGFTYMNGYVYFNAIGPGTGRELWRTDNTALGTTLVKDIIPGTGDSGPEGFAVVNNTLFFRATIPGGGVELVRSDGTAAGTVSFDLYPGTTTSTPDFLIGLDNRLLFTANHPVAGRELWKIEAPPVPSSSFTISGDTSVCEGRTVVYSATNVVGSNVVYNWSLPDGGGTLSANDSVATVTWTSLGTRRISLFLSNGAGATTPKERTVQVIAGGIPPTQAPVITAFGRTLTASGFPDSTYCQWYRNGTAITGANQPSYYAQLDGIYTARFLKRCAEGPLSNAIQFTTAAIAQTISFPDIPDITLTPTARVKLTATSTSGLPVFFQKILGPGFIQNDTLYITGSGTLVGDIVIRAIQPGNEQYSPAPDVQQTIRVIRGSQVISFDSIPDMIFGPQLYQLTAGSSAGLPVTYTVIAGSGFAAIQSGNKIKLNGAGSVTIRASQVGNANYFGATPVDRTFCIGIRNLNAISGDAAPCLNTYRYLAQKIPGAQYVWTLSGGGTIVTSQDTAWITWQTPGNYSLEVKANSACDTIFSTASVLSVLTTNNAPAPVSGMLPADNAQDQQLPLLLSWIPGANTTLYDLYVWKSTDPQPATPYAANLDGINYTLPLNALQYNTTYSWRLVSKNPCSQTAGPVQQFSIIPLPDLEVSEVQVPATATSGQTITVSWKVTNRGPGRTAPNATWYDGVYFALDTVPFVSFMSSPNWTPSSWNSLTANGRPLLLGKKIRPTSLDSGQFYTSSLNFTLPLSYSFPVYVYVITDNEHPNWKIMQVTVANDTARAPQPLDIQLAPTPDLRVDSVFTPTTTFSGSTINLTYKVKNYGVLTPAGNSWVDSVFISQSPLFDRANAIPLTIPKANGSYYPNAVDAGYLNTTQLQQDSFYTRSTPVVIPNNIFGTWFVYVKTNAKESGTNTLYEGAFVNNNLGQAQLQVFLTPTPKLVVSSLSVPVTTASTTQPIGVNWTIRNEGFRDNIEKNRGRYITLGTCQLPCNTSTPNSSCISTVTSVVRDSIAFGSSYWIDRVYLSADPGGLNTANAILVKETSHGTLNSGLYPDPVSGTFVSCPALVNGNVNLGNVISPTALYPKAEGFTVPANLAPGSYYVYVYTNTTKTVFEYPGTPQIRRSDLPIVIQQPDLTVPVISVPALTNGGTPVTISYAVQNNGPGAVFSHNRNDRIYISTSPVFDASATLIGVNSFTENLPVNTPVPHSFVYNLPPSTTGTRYFFVVTNPDSLFRETTYANNLSAAAATTVTAAVPADLVVSSIQTTDTVQTVFTSRLIYTVANNGSGGVTGSWVDSVFISCSPVYNPATSYFIGRRTQSRTVIPAAAYTDTLTLNMKYGFEINNCFPESMFSTAYFFVKANASLTAYEGTAVGNNTGSSGMKILQNPLVDHEVNQVGGPGAVSVGAAFPATWRIRNIGYNPNMMQYYYSWYDGLFFSADSIPDAGDIKAGEQLKYLRLNRNQDSAFSLTPFTPYMPSGEYYVYVSNNYTNRIPGEKNFSNNINFIREASGAAKKITVTLPALSDLTDTIVSAPPTVAAGQPLTLVYKVTNRGTGVTFPGTNWQNRVILSSDFVVNTNQGDRLLATRNRTSVLLPGQSYFDTVTVTIPISTPPGNYVLVSQANSNNIVIESNSANNNGYSLLSVFTPPVTDLTVTHVLKPDTVTLGYTIDTAKWVVVNTSGEQARGRSRDGVYLSAGSTLDSTAVLLGIRDKTILMQPLQEDTVRMAPLVTGVVEGNYHLHIKTDVQNNILESDEDNNVGVSTTPLYVRVNELPLNVDVPNSLQAVSRFYKLRIPDSLRGATILVTLQTPDSLTVRNEMYISGSAIPGPSSFDYQFEIPNYGNQRIVMTDVTDSVYYIMYRCVSPNPPVQQVNLRAVRLPFAILNVHTNAGGNIGNVTVRIRGSLFRDSMIAKLSNATTTIYASAVYYSNSGQVFATFPLQGKPLGIYDVTLIKPDLSEAILPNGFSIVPANNGGLITGSGPNTGAGNGNAPGCDPGAPSGLNSQLVVDLVVPSRVLTNRPVVILLNFSNPTNFDVPVQTRILYNDEDIKMAFTREGIEAGTSSLYIEFSEPGGPPGIIRPGGTGTITVHCRSPRTVPEDGSVLFKLK